MEVKTETLWKRCLSTPTKPPTKNSNICLSETAYQHKGTRKKCKKTNQAAIIQWQRQCLMDKPHRKPWPKSKTSDIFKQSPSPLHHTFFARTRSYPPRVWAYQRPMASHLNALDFAPYWRFIHIQICFKEPKACEWKPFWRALISFRGKGIKNSPYLWLEGP